MKRSFVFAVLITAAAMVWAGAPRVEDYDWVDGTQLPKEGEATFDFCHPNDWGAKQMGRVYAAAIRRALGEDK